MVGEGLREIGALAILFIPLDLFLRQDPWPWWIVAPVTLVVGGGTFALGMVFERLRPTE